MSKNLLLKNSCKMFLQSKWQVLQLTLLTIAGTTVITSSVLSDYSLRHELQTTQSISGDPNISFQNLNDTNEFKWDLKIIENNGLKPITNNYQFNLSNGIVEEKDDLWVYDPTKYTEYQTLKMYGFHQFYQKTSSTNTWQDLIYSPGIFSVCQSVDTKATPSKYKGQIADFYSFYKNSISPVYSLCEETKYRNLYDYNIYAFNPWSLFLTKGKLNSSIAGSFYLTSQNNQYIDFKMFSLNHNVIHKSNMQIIGTDYALGEPLTTVNNEVVLKSNALIGPNIQQLFQTSNFTNNNQFITFMQNYSSAPTIVDSTYPNDYFNFANSISNQLLFKEQDGNYKYFSKTLGVIPIKYSFNYDKSTGYIKALGDIYYNNNLSPELSVIKTLLKNKFSTFFEGIANVPLIPYITILPKKDISLITLDEFNQWKNNPQLWLQNSILNSSFIHKIIKNSLESLNNYAIEFLSGELENIYNSNPNSIKSLIDFYNNKTSIWSTLNSFGLDISKSKNYVANDINDGNFIVSSNNKVKGERTINDVVINDGISIPLPQFKEIKSFSNFSTNIARLQQKWKNIVYSEGISVFDIAKTLWNDPLFLEFISILKNSIMYTSPSDIQNIWKDKLSVLVNEPNWNDHEQCRLYVLAAIHFFDSYSINSLNWTGFGYSVCINGLYGNAWIEFFANTIDPTSTLAIVGQNYSKLKNENKKILETYQTLKYKNKNERINILDKALKLPYFVSPYLNQQLNESNLLWNYKTNKQEYFADYSSWFANAIPDEYKVSVNGNKYLLIGSGISNEFLYPITSSNQILLDNSTPVLFLNDAGFSRSMYGTSTPYIENVWCKSKNFIKANNDLYNINQTLDKYNVGTRAYFTNDNNQPNKLLYMRINFPSHILDIILILTLIIGFIICILSIFFILILLKSIIKQNINNIAICIANGVNKHKLAFSFFPFALIPSFVAGLIGYGLSILIYPLISNTIHDYWILNFLDLNFNFLFSFLIVLIIFICLFISLFVEILILTKKTASELLAENVEFKFNFLNKIFTKTKGQMKPMNAFRISYIFSNVWKILILILTMTTFSTLIIVDDSMNNAFKVATAKTDQNKLYNYAIDLYSPTEQGGYYYNIPFDEIGTRQQGLVSLYDLNKNSLNNWVLSKMCVKHRRAAFYVLLLFCRN